MQHETAKEVQMAFPVEAVCCIPAIFSMSVYFPSFHDSEVEI